MNKKKKDEKSKTRTAKTKRAKTLGVITAGLLSSSIAGQPAVNGKEPRSVDEEATTGDALIFSDVASPFAE